MGKRGAASFSRTDFRWRKTIKITYLLPRGADKPSPHLNFQYLACSVTRFDSEWAGSGLVSRSRTGGC